MKEFLRWTMEAETAPLPKVEPVLRTKTETESAHKYATVFEATDLSLMAEAKTEPVYQILEASAAE